MKVRLPRGGGLGAARRRTGACAPVGPGVQRISAESRIPWRSQEPPGAPPAAPQGAAPVASYPASEAGQLRPTSSPPRCLRGPGGCCASGSSILAGASRPGPAPPPRPSVAVREPCGTLERPAQRGRLEERPEVSTVGGSAAPLSLRGVGEGCPGSDLRCTLPAESRGGPPPQPGKRRAPGAHGGSGGGGGQPRGRRLSRLSGRPQGGPVDGF